MRARQREREREVFSFHFSIEEVNENFLSGNALFARAMHAHPHALAEF
tara:strand:- start:605 stop:748 length:144 start_codon:yes stop_codon:yes gene_type:complete